MGRDPLVSHTDTLLLEDEVSPWMIDNNSGRDLQYSLDSMSSEDLESESIVTVFGGDLVMSSTCSEDLESESIVTVFGERGGGGLGHVQYL